MLEEKEAVIQEKEAVIQEKEAVIQEKEAVIQEIVKELRAYQIAFGKFSILRPIARLIRRSVALIYPRLGNLNQYAPRPFNMDKYILKSLTLKHTPKISIVTPSYQHGRYIEFTINSVLKQTYPNLEFFVQDGGSTDGTLELLKSKEVDFTGWVSEKDNGQAQAINRGFAKTSGEIMAWLNSDDLILPGALNVVADFFNRHPDIDVVYGNRLLIDKDNMEIGRWILPGHDDTVLSWVDYIPQETLFWRRRIWEKIGGKVDESFQFALDWDLLVRFRDAGAKFHHIPQFLGAFRIHEKQKTSAQINQIGYQEMNRIRERTLGKINYQKKISGVIFLYLLKHIVVDIVYRIKTRLKVNT
jgi:glycosyltransferase involved in cell wall biosynthesis